MIRQSPSLPLAFSAARTAFSSSLNNYEGKIRSTEGGTMETMTHPPLSTFLHGLHATPPLSLYPATVWNVKYEYNKNRGKV